MSNFAQFVGGSLLRPPAAITNKHSAGSTHANFFVNPSTTGAKQYLSGALTANTLATMLTVSGPGVVCLAYAAPVDATARTIRLQIILDGVTAFDATTDSLSSVAHAIVGIGGWDYEQGAASGPTPIPTPFNASCVIKIASSLTETDKIAAYIQHWTV